MSGWQPIETAPKDGETILIVRHGRESMPSYGVVYWDEPDKKYPDHCWHFVDGGQSYHRDFPTHWMPLPEPPK